MNRLATYDPWTIVPRPVGFSPLRLGLAFDVGTAAPSLGPDFYDAWTAMARRLGADPLDMARVAFAETAMNPRAVDPRSNAGGLIGFMPSILQGLGWTGTPEEFRELSATEQVPYVERYYHPYAGYLLNEGLVYTANFLPSRLREAARQGDSYPVSQQGDPYYASNQILDVNGDGVITVTDLRQHIAQSDVGARYDTIERELRARGAGGASPSQMARNTRRALVPITLAVVTAGALGMWYLFATDEGIRARDRMEQQFAQWVESARSWATSF